MQQSRAVGHDEYSVRRSPRAGRISLRVVPGKGLEIVLPLWADENVIPMLLEKHKKWIARTLSRHAPPEGKESMFLPESVLLNGGLEEVRIVWQEAGNTPKPKLNASPAPLPDGARPQSLAEAMRGTAVARRIVTLAVGRGGALSEQAARYERLRAWVRAEAASRLAPLVEHEAERLGLQYATVRVKFQKSRWGSCSVHGNINLNACLVFLPEHLVRYIIIHELCHTRALNHSPAFWKLVFAADSDALAKDRAMRTAWRFVPGWVFAEK